MSIIASICACGAGSSSINPESVCGLICAMIVFLSVVYNIKFRKRWFCSARADGERFFVRAKNRRAGILCVFQADVLPPWRKRSGVDRRRMKPSFPNKKILSSLHWDESISRYFVVPPKFEGLALPLCRVFGAARRRFRRSSPYTPARRMSFARPPAEIFQLVISSLSGASARYCFRVTAVI